MPPLGFLGTLVEIQLERIVEHEEPRLRQLHPFPKGVEQSLPLRAEHFADLDCQPCELAAFALALLDTLYTSRNRGHSCTYASL